MSTNSVSLLWLFIGQNCQFLRNSRRLTAKRTREFVLVQPWQQAWRVKHVRAWQATEFAAVDKRFQAHWAFREQFAVWGLFVHEFLQVTLQSLLLWRLPWRLNPSNTCAECQKYDQKLNCWEWTEYSSKNRRTTSLGWSRLPERTTARFRQRETHLAEKRRSVTMPKWEQSSPLSASTMLSRQCQTRIDGHYCKKCTLSREHWEPPKKRRTLRCAMGLRQRAICPIHCTLWADRVAHQTHR